MLPEREVISVLLICIVSVMLVEGRVSEDTATFSGIVPVYACWLQKNGSCIGKCASRTDLDRLECLSVLFSFYSNLATNALEDTLADCLIESCVFAWLKR